MLLLHANTHVWSSKDQDWQNDHLGLYRHIFLRKSYPNGKKCEHAEAWIFSISAIFYNTQRKGLWTSNSSRSSLSTAESLFSRDMDLCAYKPGVQVTKITVRRMSCVLLDNFVALTLQFFPTQTKTLALFRSVESDGCPSQAFRVHRSGCLVFLCFVVVFAASTIIQVITVPFVVLRATKKCLTVIVVKLSDLSMSLWRVRMQCHCMASYLRRAADKFMFLNIAEPHSA